VVIILADDQGYGDLGCHGNTRIRTPHLDRFATQGVELTAFHVSPVCAPTRASLLTGRYNYRTGVTDTYLGRALMYADEVTLAEMLAAAGYRTGIFGKWHLGDNYPLRAIDQGFGEALVLRGGGLGQPSDPPGGSKYFDPWLWHNGKLLQARGYCSDVFTDAAMRFLEQDRRRPLFLYLAFNAPHTPLEVPERYLQMYQGTGLPDATARVYGMVTNVDDNLGRLFAKLDELRLADNTIVVFLTDNGPQQERYNAGMRGRKGTVYDGGIRVPCFLRWPGRFPAGKKIDRIAAHIDMVPTLLEACGVAKPAGVKLDGVSLLPLLTGEPTDWPDRTLYFQWHRGDEPERYRAFAARSPRWKLVQARGAGVQRQEPKYELFDMRADPAEKNDLADRHPELVEELRKGYVAWLQDVSASRGYAPPRLHLGAPQENPTVLSRQDWRGPRAGWGAKDQGHWEVHVATAGRYEITLHFPADGGTAHVVLGKARLQQAVPDRATTCTFPATRLEAGPARLEAWIASGGATKGVHHVEVRRIE
jgi:arylsulfatase A-like enzyme